MNSSYYSQLSFVKGVCLRGPNEGGDSEEGKKEIDFSQYIIEVKKK